ncbi:MAG: zinc ribbon domain-containing protein [Lachnospiraceae bacterium]|nr:zinc ribbon domain-containing protein [Lachnospiraceae bacterium]
MKIKCEYCGAMIEDTADKCPNCGAANVNVKRMVDKTPKTIEELKDWYQARKLPPYETTRFFIGINYEKPKAFGIYQDGNEFVVYKNKADGSRAVRYRGTDEAYAVNEIYLKLKSEILNQKARNSGSRSSSSGSKRSPENGFLWTIKLFLGLGVLGALHMYGFGILRSLLILVALVTIYRLGSKFILNRYQSHTIGGTVSQFKEDNPKLSKWLLYSVSDFFSWKRPTIVILVLTIVASLSIGAVYNTPHYYIAPSQDTMYVSYHGDWYEYDSYYDDYTAINSDYLPVEIQNNPADYEYDWKEGEWNSGITDFKSSQAYEDNYTTDWSSGSGSGWDSDSDYDWDSGSDWDSGGSDWDSDW